MNGEEAGAKEVIEKDVADLLGAMLEGKKVEDKAENVEGVKEGEEGEKESGLNESGGESIESEVAADAGKEGEAEGDEKDKIIEQLRAQIVELSKMKGIDEDKDVKEAKPETPDSASVEAEEGNKLVAGEFFVDDSEYNDVFESKEAMNKVLTRVYKSAVEGVLRTIPKVINNLVQTQVDIHTRTADFYAKNKDLADMKQFVGVVANDLASKHPDWNLDKLFEELGGNGKDNVGEVRRRLGIKRMQEKKEVVSDRSRKPPFPSRGSGARPAEDKEPNLTPLEKEISSLLDI